MIASTLLHTFSTSEVIQFDPVYLLNIHFSSPYNKIRESWKNLILKKKSLFLDAHDSSRAKKKKTQHRNSNKGFFPLPPQISKNHSTFHIEPVFPPLWNVVEEPFDYLARHVDADLTSVALTSESKEPARALDRSTRPLILCTLSIRTHCTQNTIHDKFDEHGWRAIYRVCIAKDAAGIHVSLSLSDTLLSRCSTTFERNG